MNYPSPTAEPERRLIGHSLADNDGIILAVDQGACALLHRIEIDIVGRAYTELTHPEDVVLNQSRVAMVQETQKPITLQKRYTRPDAAAVWCEVQVSLLSSGSDRGRLLGTLHQLTLQSVQRTPEQRWRSACRTIANLRARQRELGDDLFSDLPWSLLLQIYIAEAQGQCVGIAELAASCRSRPANVSRWLRVLDERGLVEDLAQAGCAAQLTVVGIKKVEVLLDGTGAL